MNFESGDIGIIGFGQMGKRHAKDMHDHSGGAVRIVAVCEIDDKRFLEGTQWLGYSPKRYTSVEDMLASERLDGAIIASPNHTHWGALKHFEGKRIPLIIEKPLDSTFEKILKILNFEERYQAPIMVHHVMRYSPIVRKAKELVDNGAIGVPLTFRFQLNGSGSHMHNFRRNKLTGGGQLLEKATHDLDIMLHLMNSSPKRVVAMCEQQVYGGDKSDDLRCSECDESESCWMTTQVGGTKKDGIKDINVSKDLCVFAKSADIPDNEICLIELENGAFGTHTNTFFVANYYSRVYELIGTEGVMRLCFSQPPHELETRDKSYKGILELIPKKGDARIFEFEYEGRIHYNGSPGVFEHFHDLMTGKTDKVYSPVKEAFAAEMIAVAAYESNERSGWVSIANLLPDHLRDSFPKIF